MEKHTLKLENNRLVITGVIKVNSFDDKEVKAALSESGITVKGEGLTIEDLDIGSQSLIIGGKVSCFCYDGKEMQKEPLLKRLLK